MTQIKRHNPKFSSFFLLKSVSVLFLLFLTSKNRAKIIQSLEIEAGMIFITPITRKFAIFSSILGEEFRFMGKSYDFCFRSPGCFKSFKFHS